MNWGVPFKAAVVHMVNSIVFGIIFHYYPVLCTKGVLSSAQKHLKAKSATAVSIQIWQW